LRYFVIPEIRFELLEMLNHHTVMRSDFSDGVLSNEFPSFFSLTAADIFPPTLTTYSSACVSRMAARTKNLAADCIGAGHTKSPMDLIIAATTFPVPPQWTPITDFPLIGFFASACVVTG
jgi:hypothetical protein